MKTPPVKFRFIVLGVIAAVAIVSCCNFPLITDTRSYVEFGHDVRGKIPQRTYVPWKSQQQFDDALAQVYKNGGKICICVLQSSGGKPYKHKLSNCTYKCPSESIRTENIRTVSVIKSKTANNTVAAESVANDPNVTWRIQASMEDMNNVMSTLSP